MGRGFSFKVTALSAMEVDRLLKSCGRRWVENGGGEDSRGCCESPSCAGGRRYESLGKPSIESTATSRASEPRLGVAIGPCGSRTETGLRIDAVSH